jgi:hypothetical protein
MTQVTQADRELLELVAEAIGFDLVDYSNMLKDDWIDFWNPLANDGDAFRLAIKLHIGLEYQAPDYRPYWTVIAKERGGATYASETGEDQYAAARRAIVRVAVEK